MVQFLTNPYIILLFAILAEALGTSFIKDARGFTVLVPTLIVIASFSFALYCMSHASASIPVSVAYAIWSGLGLIIASLVAYFKYAYVPNYQTTLGIFLILLGSMIIYMFNDFSH